MAVREEKRVGGGRYTRYIYMYVGVEVAVVCLCRYPDVFGRWIMLIDVLT